MRKWDIRVSRQLGFGSFHYRVAELERKLCKTLYEFYDLSDLLL